MVRIRTGLLAGLLLLTAACGQRLGTPVASGPEPAPSPPGRPPAFPTPAAPDASSPLQPAPSEGVDAPAPRVPRPYRGLGAWVDIFDRRAWRDPEATVAALAARDVRTLFLETQTYRFPGPFRFPDRVGTFLEAAHARGIAVVAWYVPGFVNLDRDLARSVTALSYTSPNGERFDGFALDIEVTAVADPVKRADRLLRLSRAIRVAAGPAYPLGAIVPSPLRSPSYWPVLPLAELAEVNDVILPMAYWTVAASGRGGAHDYIRRSIQVVRAETGGAPVHVIGGLAEDAPPAEIAGFVSAARDAGVLGASLYDAATTRPAGWRVLRRV